MGYRFYAYLFLCNKFLRTILYPLSETTKRGLTKWNNILSIYDFILTIK